MKRLLALGLIFALALAIGIQVDVEPVFAADGDGDGIDDALEQLLGTNPQLADSDGDTWSDFKEVFEEGTDPNLMDTDGDAIDDDQDSDPLDDGTYTGGRNTPSRTWSSNLTPSAITGSSPFEGMWVSALTGQVEAPLVTIDFGPGYRERNVMTLTYFSGNTLNDRWGKGVFSSWDHWVEEQGDDDVEVYFAGRKFLFDESSGTYTAPNGCPFTLSKDTQADEFTLTAIKGGKEWVFDATNGWLDEIADRFGNTTTITRNGSGVITGVDLPEGNSLVVTTHNSGRYYQISDWSDPGRMWVLKYNYYDELAKFTDARGYTRQFFYMNAVNVSNLNGNLTRVKLGSGVDLVKIEYDQSDRVTKQTTENFEATFSYTSTSTTVNDFAGNQRVWNMTSGAIVPNSVVAYSNRDVRTSDPATWTTTFAHNTDLLRTKIVYPEGNRVDFDWDSDFCLTEKRKKATDTDTDSGSDLVWSYTYGSTYNQLDKVTDPEGNETDRTFDTLEFVTQVSYETITHLDPDVTITESFTRNSNGQLTEHTDGEGVKTKYEYYTTGEEKGLLHKRTEDYGTGKLNLVHTFAYSDTRYLTSYTDPDSIAWTYTVDEEGNRTKETSPSPQGYETVYTIDQNGRLAAKDVENVDETNTRDTSTPWWVTSYTWSPRGALMDIQEEITSSTTRTTSISRDGNTSVTEITHPEGNKTKQVWDERGLLAERTRGYNTSDAATEKWKYDDNGNLTTYTDGRGKDWTKTYDDYDRLTKEATPIGHYTSYVLDDNGNVTEIKGYNSSDTLLAHTKQHFDELNRVWKVERWLDEPAPTADRWLATTYTHDKAHRVTQVSDPEGNDTYFTFDNVGRKTGWEDDIGNEITHSYANDYLVATQIQEIEKKPTTGTETFTTEVVTDNLHRVIERRVVDRDNSSNKHVFKAKYTSLHVAVEREDAEGNKTYYEHDGLGRVTKSEVDLGGTDKIETWFTFDKNNNQTKLKDDNGNETIWTFDNRDLPTKITYEDNEDRSFTYNDDDSLSGWTDENGTVVSNTYDNDGRLTYRNITRATNVLGPTSETYAYDGLGRMTTAQNTNSTVYFTYDTLSRLIEEEQGPNPIGGNGKTISYTYNDDGSRASVEYFSGYDLTYTVDSIGRWTKIEDASSNDLATWEYYGPSRRTKKLTHLNGTTANYAYDGFRRVTDIAHKDSQSTEFAGFDYAYDKMGNPLYVERSHDSGAGDIYAYDNAYRLTSALIGSTDPSAEVADSDWLDYAHVKQIDYNMDDVGNRTSVVETPYQGQSVTTSYTTNEVNQYTVVGGQNKSYDDNGNLLTGSSLFYDYRNNLVEVVEGETTVATYEYDALNRQIKVTLVTITIKFFYDGWHCVEEFDGSDNLLRRFIYGQWIDEILFMITPDHADVDGDQDTSEWINLEYHRDNLGSVTQITCWTGDVVEQYEYSPYGVTTIEDGQGNDLSGQSAIGNPFMFTGRRFDDVTGFYHYRGRAYDPNGGRFLQRDPLGYVDGPSLYEYALSRPSAIVDPLGTSGAGAAAAGGWLGKLVEAIGVAGGGAAETAGAIALPVIGLGIFYYGLVKLLDAPPASPYVPADHPMPCTDGRPYGPAPNTPEWDLLNGGGPALASATERANQRRQIRYLLRKYGLDREAFRRAIETYKEQYKEGEGDCTWRELERIAKRLSGK